MKVQLIVQARMGSTRLYGKVLKEVLNKPLLGHLLDRLKALKQPQQITIATSTLERDQPIVEFCKKQKVDYFLGSEENVLERFYQCAVANKSDVIIRLTADCPLISYKLIDKMICTFIKESSCDYLSNAYKRSYPKGLDCEIFSFKALEKAYKEAKSSYQKEHVTPYIYQNPHLFNIHHFPTSHNKPELLKQNFSVDTQSDFLFVKNLIEVHTIGNPLFDILEVL